MTGADLQGIHTDDVPTEMLLLLRLDRVDALSILIRSEKAEKELSDIVSGSALVRNSSSSFTCCLVSSCLRDNLSLTRRVLSSTN